MQGELIARARSSPSFCLKWKKLLAKKEFAETSVSVWHHVQIHKEGPEETPAQVRDATAGVINLCVVDGGESPLL